MLAMLRVDFRRLLTSAGFYAAIGCTFALYVLSAFPEMRLMGADGSVYYYFNCANSFNSLTDVLTVLAVLPFAYSVCEDYQHKYYRALLVRTDIAQYCHSKLIVCFCAAFCATVLGLLLFLGALSLCFPMYSAEMTANAFTDFANTPFLGLLFPCIIRGFAAAFWATVAMTAGTYLPTYFVTFSAPLIFNKLLNVLILVCFPTRSLLFILLPEGLSDFGSWQASLLVPCGIFTAGALIMGLLFRRRMREVFYDA